jgi:NNP family nitrate/nitrite transporter-like MFS transporter
MPDQSRLLVRLIAGPCCDRFGPRLTFAGTLLAGAIPTALAGCVKNAPGLLVLRFFIGILGASFVPCQVWSTGFFDKNVVGSANALTAGFGNAGGGITYFVMPAIFDSLVARQHLTHHVAWRVAFVVPFILISATAIAMIITCPDTPTGKWADRHLHAQQSLEAHHVKDGIIVDVPGVITGEKSPEPSGTTSLQPLDDKLDKNLKMSYDHEAVMGEQEMLDVARGEVVVEPTINEAMKVTFSLQTLVLGSAYLCSFGAELAINSILGAYYLANFPKLGQTGSGRWAAMFGLLNVVFRPLGGAISDVLYRNTHSLWAKKYWIHSLALVCGIFQIIIGVLNPHDKHMMFGLIAGMAFFMEAGNGANFSLIPHVHPFANGESSCHSILHTSSTRLAFCLTIFATCSFLIHIADCIVQVLCPVWSEPLAISAALSLPSSSDILNITRSCILSVP